MSVPADRPTATPTSGSTGVRWLFAALAIASTVVGSTQPVQAFKEKEVQERYCAGLPIDQYLKDGTEVDCIKDDIAIEVDFTDHWYEAIGQSLHYAMILERRPAVILVCNENLRIDTCRRHLSRFLDTLNYWRVGMLVWFCNSRRDVSLEDCEYTDLYEDGDFK